MFYKVIKVKFVCLTFGQPGYSSEFNLQDSPFIYPIDKMNGGQWDMFIWPYPEFCAAVMDIGHTYKIDLTLLLNTRANTDIHKRTNPL